MEPPEAPETREVAVHRVPFFPHLEKDFMGDLMKYVPENSGICSL
jgi:hypothetical protein